MIRRKVKVNRKPKLGDDGALKGAEKGQGRQAPVGAKGIVEVLDIDQLQSNSDAEMDGTPKLPTPKTVKPNLVNPEESPRKALLKEIKSKPYDDTYAIPMLTGDGEMLRRQHFDQMKVGDQRIFHCKVIKEYLNHPVGDDVFDFLFDETQESIDKLIERLAGIRLICRVRVTKTTIL